MDIYDFIELVDKVVDQFIDQVDAETADFMRTTSWAGEWGETIECLVATLVKNRIPVTPAQRADLALLWEYLKQPAEKLDDLNMIVPMNQPEVADTPQKLGSNSGDDQQDPSDRSVT